MAVSAGLWEYIKAAFKARFFGMFVSPAWVILGVFGFLGVMINPGFLLIGIGVEIGYLFMFATHPRFQDYVQRQIQDKAILQTKTQWLARINKYIQQLGEESRERFCSLRSRCDSILEFYSTQMTLAPTLIDAHTDCMPPSVGEDPLAAQESPKFKKAVEVVGDCLRKVTHGARL